MMSTNPAQTQQPTDAAALFRLDLGIGGMSCASCVSRLEKALEKQPGVTQATVNLATESAHITLSAVTDAQTAARLKRAVRDAGYEPRSMEATDAQEDERWHGVRRDFLPVLAGLLLATPLVLPMVGELFGRHWMLPAWIQFALATPVQFWLGARFYKAGWQALKAGSSNMDLLVALGTTAAWALSTWLWWSAEAGAMVHLYYEVAAVVIALVLLGKWLEARARRQTSSAIRALHALRPERAHLLPDGVRRTEISDVPVDELLPGDCIRVLPGERFAADGVLLLGHTQADESMLTGESMPVPKQAGDGVIGGSINGEGAVDVQVRAVGVRSVLSQIVSLVQNAQASKAPVQRLVDRVAEVFVPLVVLIALLTLGGWWWSGAGFEQALLHAMAVLVIACPCALGLATPTAIMAGTGVAAQHGILIKDVQSLEVAHRVDTVVFDKTGTLSEGRPRLQKIEVATGGDEWAVLQAASALQAQSTHPLAHAVLQAADARGALGSAAAQDVQALAGRGSLGTVQGARLALGSLRWMGELGVSLGPLSAAAQTLQSQGATVSALARQNGGQAGVWEPLALLAFGDDAKPGAAAALTRLRAQGLRLFMLSGDNQGAVRAMARTLGLRAEAGEVIAEVLPGDKAALIERLKLGERDPAAGPRTSRSAQRAAHTVAMVGDGVNDAPALAAADVGLAMSHSQGASSDVAMHAAGITLLRGDVGLVAAALDISRRTVVKIRQNLFWAFVYNVAAIPLAALGYLSPMLAGAAMVLSSLSVVGNALLLKRWRPPRDDASTAAVPGR